MLKYRIYAKFMESDKDTFNTQGTYIFLHLFLIIGRLVFVMLFVNW